MFKKFFFVPNRFNPELLTDFFESGMSENTSPLLSKKDRKFSSYLSLKSALFSAVIYTSGLLAYKLHALNLCNFLILLTFFIAGTPAVIKSIEDVLNKSVNIDSLMTVAAFGSIFINGEKEGALLLVLFAISEAMSQMVSSKTKNTLSSLKKLTPNVVWVINEDGTLAKTLIKQVKVGQIIKIKSGEVVPLDGIIIRGSSSLNLMHLTGEKIPQACKEADQIPAGAYNIEGAFDLEVTRLGSDSTVERIIQLVVQAQNTKPRLQRKLDRYSSIYAATIFIIATVVAIGLPLISSTPFLGQESSFYKALSFLIAASPCALIIAVPIAYLSAINACAKKGILLKGGITLDAVNKCDAIVMDKTGTLTIGELTCIGYQIFGKFPDYNPLSLAMALEQSSSHPIAQAIVDFSQKEGVVPLHLTAYHMIPGIGVEALIEEEKVFIGKSEFIMPMVSEDLRLELTRCITESKEKGDTCSLLKTTTGVLLFRFKDSPRPEACEVIKQLKNLNMTTIMLTGDHKTSALNIASELNITEVLYDLDPAEKLHAIRNLAEKHNLIMVGDGINDAPSLAQATVGVAMGQVGSASAIEAADVVLLRDNLTGLIWLINKAKQTQNIVLQNLGLAAAIILLISVPALFGIIPLWLAVILHEGSTIIVGLNALRLLKT
ncbi:MAG: cation-translocating P-type ATPase [Victivallaceae bacterium]